MDAEIKERWQALKAEEAALDQTIRPQINALYASIEPRLSEIVDHLAAIEDEYGEMFECEVCSCAHPLDEAESIYTDTGPVCRECANGWRKAFAACEHDWEPNEIDGDIGRSCKKCGGFVVDDASVEAPV